MKQFKKAVLLALIPAMLTVNAVASVCGGKQVYVKIPADWSAPFYYYAGGAWGTVTSAALQEDDWYVFNLTGGPTHDENSGFALAKENGHGMPTQRWIGGIDYNTGMSPADNASTRISCSYFGSGDVIYISEDPTRPGKTGINYPFNRYFYFLPPNDENWIAGTPYFVSGGNAVAMEIDPDRCGWFRKVFFDKPVPYDDNFIWPGNTNEVGQIGIFHLRSQFDQLLSDSLFFIPEDGANGWYTTDRNRTGVCEYSGVSIVYGDVWKDDGDGNPAAPIRNLGEQNKRTVAGRLVPVGFADGYWEGNRFYVNTDPTYGSHTKTFTLDQAGLIDTKTAYSGLRVFTDSLGQNEILPFGSIAIGGNGLRVLWITGEYAAEDDATYKLMIPRRGAAGGISEIKVFLPRFKFIDNATNAILPQGTWQTKGSDYSKRGPNVAAREMGIYLGSSEIRMVAAYDVSGSNGTEPGVLCTDCGTIIPFNLRADEIWSNNPSLGSGGSLVSTSFSPLNNGISTLTFRGNRGIMHPDYAFLKVGGPSRASKTLAQWDSLQFAMPPAAFPINAEIYDRNGDGIGDELRVTYDRKFHMDSLPSKLLVTWEPGNTLEFGLGKKEGDVYSNKDINPVENRAYWNGYHSNFNTRIEHDSIIVIYDIDFSNDVRTSVGFGNDIYAVSWVTAKDPFQVGTEKNYDLTVYIEDKIPAIVVSAIFEADANPNCSSSANPGCIDRVLLNLSEPVVYKDAETQAEAVKAAFAYKLRSYYGIIDSPFEVYYDHLPTTMRWSSTGGDGILLGGDSVVNFAFKRYKVPGDTTKTPMPLDSVKFASTVHGVELPALVDLAGNAANPMEIGRLIDYSTPISIRPPQIASANYAFATKNVVHLQTQNSATLDIYSLNGKLAKTLNFTSGVHSVSLSHLPKGVYIIKVSFGEEANLSHPIILRAPVM